MASKIDRQALAEAVNNSKDLTDRQKDHVIIEGVRKHNALVDYMERERKKRGLRIIGGVLIAEKGWIPSEEPSLICFYKVAGGQIFLADTNNRKYYGLIKSNLFSHCFPEKKTSGLGMFLSR